MRRPSLRNDLLLRLLLPMCAVLLVSGVLSYVLAMGFSRASYDRSLLGAASDVARQLKIENNVANIELPRAAIEILEWDGEDRVHYQVASRRFGTIAGERDLPLPAQGERRDLPTFYDARLRGDIVRAVSFPVQGLPTDDQLTVRVAETRFRHEAMTEDIVLAVLAPQLLLIAFSVLAIWGGIRAGLAPLERLARAVDARARDDPTQLPVDEVPREAKPLIDAFNGLLGRLGAVLEAQQRFIADAAHQLRTPLAALKVQLERALRERDPELHEQALQQIVESVERSARLSNQLLLLARAEPGVACQFAPIDLRQLAFETGSRWVPRALQAGRDFGFAGAETPVLVEGDGLLLGELINNLLDNALRYGGPLITLRVDAGAEPALAVEDNGRGIPVQERDKVFERFHRVPGSGGDGSGLGLAIVREIAQSHGAKVILDSPEGGGTRVLLRFPPARSRS